VDELYVVARGVLLDALEALGNHRQAVVLVGAQAIYLRVGEADVAVAPYTTDGDLAVDPSVLSTIPPLEQALAHAGFLPKSKSSVGIWVTQRSTSTGPSTEVAVDLLVPDTVTPGGGRAAQLSGHDKRVARKVRGLEGALVDCDLLDIGALAEHDRRVFNVRVAGAAAMLTAKVYKIEARAGTERQKDKDALDVLRVLRGTDTEDVVERFQRLLADVRTGLVATRALELLQAQFADQNRPGAQMAARAAGPLADPREIAGSCAALTLDLLSGLNTSSRERR
jgi:hypothetical protein